MSRAAIASPRPSAAATSWSLRLPRGRSLELGGGAPPFLLGIVNLTPDSFSDGGRHLDPQAGAEHALRLLAQGADGLDLGAESTRPGGGVYGGGAHEVPADEELRRLLPVLRYLRSATDAVLSVDTRKAEVARVALAEGADLINDVSALGDGAMGEVLAAAGCPVVLMHARGDLTTMQQGIHFDDVVEDVARELEERRQRAHAAGIADSQILVDPGIGFGKTAEQNLLLLRRTQRLSQIGRPLVVGASRKSFIAAVSPAGPDERLGGSLAAAAAARQGGAAVLRVHDIGPTRQFLRLLQAIEEAE